LGKRKITVVKIKKLRRYKRFSLEELAEIEIKLKFENFFALEEVAESKKENKKPLMYFLFTKLSPKNYQIIFKMNMKIILLSVSVSKNSNCLLK
jgi:hypothetical protein